MRGEVPDRARWVLVMIDLSGRMDGSTRLQKLAFLASQMVPDLAKFEFYSDWRPSKYGPFSPTLSEDVEGLESRELVKKVQVQFSETSTLDQYFLTTAGKTLAVQTEEGSPDLVNSLRKSIISKYSKAPLMELLHVIYYQYPEYTIESRVAGDVFGFSKSRESAR